MQLKCNECDFVCTSQAASYGSGPDDLPQHLLETIALAVPLPGSHTKRGQHRPACQSTLTDLLPPRAQPYAGYPLQGQYEGHGAASGPGSDSDPEENFGFMSDDEHSSRRYSGYASEYAHSGELHYRQHVYRAGNSTGSSRSSGSEESDDEDNSAFHSASTGYMPHPCNHPFLSLTRGTRAAMASGGLYYRWLLQEPDRAAERLLATPAAVAALRAAAATRDPFAAHPYYPPDMEGAMLEALHELARVHRVNGYVSGGATCGQHGAHQLHFGGLPLSPLALVPVIARGWNKILSQCVPKGTKASLKLDSRGRRALSWASGTSGSQRIMMLVNAQLLVRVVCALNCLLAKLNCPLLNSTVYRAALHVILLHCQAHAYLY